MGTDEFETDIGHMAPLSSDSIPDINQSHFCHSCETPFTGVYCTACGQKNDDYRRSIFSLIKEFLGSITAIESRIWRTWGALLFKPGKVAREFANGRRTYWSSPVRVYFAMSILLFGFLSVSQMQLISLDVDVKPANGVEKPQEDWTAEDIRLVPAVRFFETRKQIDQRNQSRNFDLIVLRLKSDDGLKIDLNTGEPDESLADRMDAAGAQLEELGTPAETSGGGADTLPESEVSSSGENEKAERSFTFSALDGKTYELGSTSEILLAMIKNPEKINGTFFKYLPRIMFIMMPFTMLIGAMFIRGRGNALLYDHLVHAAYIHAFAFFLLLLGIILSALFPGDLISKIIFIILLVYLPLSLKKMFNRSWRKTIWTSYGVGFIYAFNLTIIMTALLGLQIVNTLIELGTPLDG